GAAVVPGSARPGGGCRQSDRYSEDYRAVEGGHGSPYVTSARDQLEPVSVTGIVNTAPWHAFSDAFDMLAAPVSVVWSTPSTPPLFAGTLSERLLWFVNVTPVVVHPEWPASAVIVPLPVTAVTVTAYGFGLSIL